MAGTASSQIRSAYVAEVTPGITPATPGFKTLHRPARMQAAAMPEFGRSLVSRGARFGHGINGIDVTGTLDGPLIYGVYDDLLATLFQGEWATNVLKDGKALSSVTVENTLPAGVGGTNTMLRYRGVEALSGTLSLQARSPVALNLALGGMGSDTGATTAISGATYTDPTEADPLSSGGDVGTITMAGYTLDCMERAEISFAFEGRDPQPKIGSNDLCGFTRGDFLPVITARFLIEPNFLAIYNASRARHSAFAVTFQLGSISGEKYTLLFPACYFGPAEIDQSGAIAMQSAQIMPTYSTADACVAKLTRAVA